MKWRAPHERGRRTPVAPNHAGPETYGCAPRRGLAPPGVCHCALISYRIRRNKYHNPKQQWGNAMAVTPTPITKMTFGWYMIYDTTMTGREKYPYVIAIRETLPWSGNSKNPGMKKIKPPSSRLWAFPMTDGKRSHGRFTIIPPARHVPSRGSRARPAKRAMPANDSRASEKRSGLL